MIAPRVNFTISRDQHSDFQKLVERIKESKLCVCLHGTQCLNIIHLKFRGEKIFFISEIFFPFFKCSHYIRKKVKRNHTKGRPWNRNRGCRRKLHVDHTCKYTYAYLNYEKHIKCVEVRKPHGGLIVVTPIHKFKISH